METYSFQITDILSDDVPLNPTKPFDKTFLISIYGIDENQERIVCHVQNYYPYFFLKVPNDSFDWDQSKCTNFLKYIQDKKKKPMKNIKYIESVYSHDFYGFKWDFQKNQYNKYQFYKLSFTNLSSMKTMIENIKTHYHSERQSKDPYSDWLDLERTDNCDSNVYESFVHPVIRFIHDSGIQPTGWVECDCNNKYRTDLYDILEVSCQWAPKNIRKLENNNVSEYVIASYDIECDSSHGDFPLAKKDFKKLAIDVFESLCVMYQKTPNMMKSKMIENIDIYLSNLLFMGFEDIDDLEIIYKYADINHVFLQDDACPEDDTIDEIIVDIQKKTSLLDNIQDGKLKAKERDTTIQNMNKIFNAHFKKKNIKVEGDPIIQIGTVFHRYGEKEPYLRHILVIGPEKDMKKDDICDTMEDLNIVVKRCKTEEELLFRWSKIIQTEDPDFITGYNIFGFDFKYIKNRVDELIPHDKKCHPKWGCDSRCKQKLFFNLGKTNQRKAESQNHYNKKCNYKYQKLSSSALGENDLNYITMDGRILFDIQKEVEKGHNLESYKLDNVAAHFMRGKIKEIHDDYILTDNIGHLKNGDFISFRTHNNIGEELYQNGRKIQINTIDDQKLYLEESLQLIVQDYHKIEWCLNKDDISPQDIFDKHKQLVNGATARAEVAKYCIQDCELCIHLLLLLDIIPNNLAMANVSYVPASYIFLRGQGVKVTSVVARMCSLRNTRMPDLKKMPNPRDYIKLIRNGSNKEEVVKQIIKDETNNGEEMYKEPKDYELREWYDSYCQQAMHGIDGYEGAIVLDPTPGIYLDDPIAVMDYGSLYPSSIIEKNCSHETIIEDETLLSQIGEGNYHTVPYDNWIYRGKGKGDTIEKVKNEDEPIKTCYFIKPEFMKKNGAEPVGIIPSVLQEVLDARKRTKNLMKTEKNEFKYKVLDGLQLAYKVTANSVYGQLGAKTSTIFKMNLAACTTSIGRERLTIDAQIGVEEWAKKYGHEKPEIVYGDTDSVFVKFSRMKDGKLLTGVEGLKHCIDCGLKSADYIQEKMDLEGKQPQVLEYEKTFWPFILISKKRYTGDKYEFDTVNKKRTAMGIVLKRRDNAPIVKYVFGHVIEKIMIDRDFDMMIEWLKETLSQIRNGEFDDRYFVITKSLRGYYKNPQQIAHKVLADRMAERDPGNKPKSNDRIPYAYIQLPDKELYDYENPYKSGTRKGKPRVKDVKQGDRIEHIDYIQKHKLSLDYEFYITNQIMNPVKQVLDLHLDPKETEKLFMK